MKKKSIQKTKKNDLVFIMILKHRWCSALGMYLNSKIIVDYNTNGFELT